jgi:hypothetical protein
LNWSHPENLDLPMPLPFDARLITPDLSSVSAFADLVFERPDRLFQGATAMRDSSGYQAILDEGRTEEARKILLLLGRDQFGEPDPTVLTALTAINETERLEELAKRIRRAASWQDLFATP